MNRVFLLSPASTDGIRAGYLFSPRSPFPAAMALRARRGATVGEVFSFLSGLYFRGKLAYAHAFQRPPRGVRGAYVITSSRGLLHPNERIRVDDLQQMRAVRIDVTCAAYREPLLDDVRSLVRRMPRSCEVVLLGSIASKKYVHVLLGELGERLLFPVDFVGRGDMSRGGLLLRSVADGVELPYAAVQSSVRKGGRPSRLTPRPGLQALVRNKSFGRR